MSAFFLDLLVVKLWSPYALGMHAVRALLVSLPRDLKADDLWLASDSCSHAVRKLFARYSRPFCHMLTLLPAVGARYSAASPHQARSTITVTIQPPPRTAASSTKPASQRSVLSRGAQSSQGCYSRPKTSAGSGSKR